jgi:hypothetical protein
MYRNIDSDGPSKITLTVSATHRSAELTPKPSLKPTLIKLLNS